MVQGSDPDSDVTWSEGAVEVSSTAVDASLNTLSTATALGLSWAGRGARHLLRYGNRGSAVILLSAAGLGGSIFAAVCTRALLEFAAHPMLSGLNQIAMGASGLFTAAILIQVLVLYVGCFRARVRMPTM